MVGVGLLAVLLSTGVYAQLNNSAPSAGLLEFIAMFEAEQGEQASEWVDPLEISESIDSEEQGDEQGGYDEK